MGTTRHSTRTSAILKIKKEKTKEPQDNNSQKNNNNNHTQNESSNSSNAISFSTLLDNDDLSLENLILLPELEPTPFSMPPLTSVPQKEPNSELIDYTVGDNFETKKRKAPKASTSKRRKTEDSADLENKTQTQQELIEDLSNQNVKIQAENEELKKECAKSKERESRFKIQLLALRARLFQEPSLWDGSEKSEQLKNFLNILGK